MATLAWVGCVADTPELKATTVLERLRGLGFTGGITIVRDRVSKLRPREAKTFLTLDFAPASVMQVDWADFGYALPGCPRRVSAFVAVLGYSRLLYIEFTVSQAFGSFVRCMDRALSFFGGTTTMSLFDNMKTVVLSHTPLATRFNRDFLEFARVRGGFGVVACNVRSPHEKGRVERPIGFVRDRFWPGRRFTDLLDLNRQATSWRDEFANHRVHETTGKVPALVFENEEKKLLKPLSTDRFDTDDRDGTGVTKMCRVRFDRNLYSVPWRLVSQSVVIRADDQMVSIFLGPKQVALHVRNALLHPLPGAVEDLSRHGVAHARIREINTRAALAMPGVVAVLTAADLPKITPSSRSRLDRCRPRCRACPTARRRSRRRCRCAPSPRT